MILVATAKDVRYIISINLSAQLELTYSIKPSIFYMGMMLSGAIVTTAASRAFLNLFKTNIIHNKSGRRFVPELEREDTDDSLDLVGVELSEVSCKG